MKILPYAIFDLKWKTIFSVTPYMLKRLYWELRLHILVSMKTNVTNSSLMPLLLGLYCASRGSQRKSVVVGFR